MIKFEVNTLKREGLIVVIVLLYVIQSVLLEQPVENYCFAVVVG